MKSWIDDNKLIFECGCTFDIKDNSLVFVADLHNPDHNINFECKETYKLISQGLTQGVFQLCSPLGTQWCRKVNPDKIEHLAALGALLRPGCLESKDDKGISTTIHYERRKNGKEETPSYLPIVDKILSDTYNCLIYQEQAIEIVKECAGFTPNEADSLRRSMGKKDVEEMQKNKKLFLEKAKSFGVLNEQQAIEVFNWIEASQRYSFNRAHANAYGQRGYVTAYIKAHFPLQFYKEWLKNEKDREEYLKLSNEAKLFNINVYPPDLRDLRPDFYIKRGNIYFGYNNIKGLVKKDIESLARVFAEKNWAFSQLGKEISWLDFMSVGLESVSSKTAEGLIRSGALDCFSLARAEMYYQYERWNQLTPTEKKPLTAKEKDLWEDVDLAEYIKYIVLDYISTYNEKLEEYKDKVAKREASTRKRTKEPKPFVEPKENRRLPKLRQILQELESPLYNIREDTIDGIIFAEEDLLGVALTKHKTDEIANCAETATCKDILDGRKGYNVLRVKVEDCRLYACKNGQSAGRNMAFIKLSDKTGVISVVAFPDVVDEYQHLLTRGSVVFVSGELSKDSFQIKRAYSVG